MFSLHRCLCINIFFCELNRSFSQLPSYMADMLIVSSVTSEALMPTWKQYKPPYCVIIGQRGWFLVRCILAKKHTLLIFHVSFQFPNPVCTIVLGHVSHKEKKKLISERPTSPVFLCHFALEECFQVCELQTARMTDSHDPHLLKSWFDAVVSIY